MLHEAMIYMYKILHIYSSLLYVYNVSPLNFIYILPQTKFVGVYSNNFVFLSVLTHYMLVLWTLVCTTMFWQIITNRPPWIERIILAAREILLLRHCTCCTWITILWNEHKFQNVLLFLIFTIANIFWLFFTHYSSV